MLKVSARIFPIGYIISVDNPDFDPHDFYIDGVWERIKGRVIVGVDENQTEFNETGKFGGEKTHALSIAELATHNHNINYNTGTGGYATGYLTAGSTASLGPHGGWSVITENVGSGTAHNNLQPYYVAYIWKLVSYSN